MDHLCYCPSRIHPGVKILRRAILKLPIPGSYYIYQANVNDGPVGIWDFPQVGLDIDQNAVIFTANFFNSITRNFIDARMFAVAKSLLYNGPGQPSTSSTFTGRRAP